MPDRPGPAPQPANATPAHHLTPMSLYTLGFRGWNVGGVECVLPSICPVPGSSFMMECDPKHAVDIDKHSGLVVCSVSVEDFSIGQHPVSVTEYACAVQAGTVREPPERNNEDRKLDWLAQLSRSNHPVVSVSWHDANRYAHWLAQTTGQLWRLPSAEEWEKMARWDAANGRPRTYPWGERFDGFRANTAESGIGSTTPIGQYPDSASPCGALDVIGNVAEWTSSISGFLQYNQLDGQEAPPGTYNRELRGGCWFDYGHWPQHLFIGGNRPDVLSIAFGFRLALGVS